MKPLFRQLQWREALPRMAADFLIVQAAGLAALLVAASIRIFLDGGITADAFRLLVGAYYTGTFLPLSPIFPATFVVLGFYSYARTYRPDHKLRGLLRGSLLACLIYLFASFILTRDRTLPRSSMLVFVALVVTGIVGARWLKLWILDRERKPAPPPAASDEYVLVVGGAGYIGSILVRRLLDAGHRVRVLDSLVYGDSAIRPLLAHPRFELLVGDCRNIQCVVSAIRGVHSVIHLAAIVGDPACEQDRASALEINFAATRMLAEVAKGHGVERLIFASSCSVYGASEALMDEMSKVTPISLYAQTKVDSERALLESESATFHPTVLRFATIFGYSPRPRFDLVVNLLTAKAFQQGVITIFNGQQWRPFLHVDDVARAIAEVLAAPVAVTSGQIFNVGDSRLNHTLADVAARIRNRFPGTVVEEVENSDRRNYRVNFEKIRQAIGFEAQWDLERGIAELERALSTGEIGDYANPLYHNQRYLAQTGPLANRNPIDTGVMAAFARSLPALDSSLRDELEPKAL